MKFYNLEILYIEHSFHIECKKFEKLILKMERKIDFLLIMERIRIYLIDCRDELISINLQEEDFFNLDYLLLKLKNYYKVKIIHRNNFDLELEIDSKYQGKYD